jgi:hypothetical protein
MGILGICKLWTVVALGSHAFPVPALFFAGPFAVTPIGVVSAACFLAKHPGKPMTPLQWKQWDKTYKQYGLR